MSVAFFTICAKNYLPVARACLRTVKCHHPSATVFLFLCDEVDQGYEISGEEFQVIPIREVAVGNLEDLKLRYQVMELNTAVKPWCFLHLFDREFTKLIYLDPDTWVISPLEEALRELSYSSDAVVTPHVLAPVRDGDLPDEYSVLRVGVFNLGFLGLSDTEEVRDYLHWWGDRLRLQGGVDLEAGLFTDQRWCDLLPCFIGNTHILRHKGYNVAYWNLMQRQVVFSGSDWLAGGELLRFIHFSGASFVNDEVFSKHQTRFSSHNIGEGMAQLYYLYREAVARERRSGDAQLSYSWNLGPNGQPIPNALRRLYAKHVAPNGPVNATSPIVAAEAIASMDAPGFPKFSGLPLNMLMVEVWNRPDLRLAFALQTKEGRSSYLRWFATSGLAEDPALSIYAQQLLRDIGPTLQAKVAATSRKIALARSFLKVAPRLRALYSRLPTAFRHRWRDKILAASGVRSRPSHEVVLTAPACEAELQDGALLIGYVRGQLGMGEHVRMTAKSMLTTAVPFGMLNFDVNVAASQGDRRFDHLLTSDAVFRVNILHINADQLSHAFTVLGADMLKGRVNVGYPAWELDSWPEDWVAPMMRLDEIWAPSKFIQRAISRAVDRPVVWMPLAVELAEGHEIYGRSSFKLPERRYIFLFIFDFASYAARKNPSAVIEAFKVAFPTASEAGPLLLIKTISGDRHPDALNKLKGSAARTDIQVLDGTLDVAAVHGLINVCDCFVSLHRSEGFGRGLAEAMRLGKPVICTGYSGNMDFTSQETARLINFEMRPVEPEEYPYSNGAKWAQPIVKEAALAMEELATDPQLGVLLGRRAKSFMEAHHSPAVIGARYSNALVRLGALSDNVVIRDLTEGKSREGM